MKRARATVVRCKTLGRFFYCDILEVNRKYLTTYHEWVRTYERHWVYVFFLQACAPCHPECRTCQQYSPYECLGDCVNFVEDARCVAACSPSHYAADDRRCLQCDVTCSNCTGPSASDCTSCRQFTVFDDFPNRHLPGATVRVDKLLFHLHVHKTT